MGVSIHYRGRMDDISQIPVLCKELIAIAKEIGWQSNTLDDDWEQPVRATIKPGIDKIEIIGNLGLKGVQIIPSSESEPFNLFFDQKGNLRSPIDMIYNMDKKPEESWVSIKTQFAPPEVHVWIIGQLKYLKKRYISDLEVSDEGEYWETGDIKILKRKMAFINEKLEHITNELSLTPFEGITRLSAEQIASWIEQMFYSNEQEKENVHTAGTAEHKESE